MRGREARQDRQRLADQVDARLKLAGLYRQYSHQVQGGRIARVLLQHFAVDRPGFCHLALLLQRMALAQAVGGAGIGSAHGLESRHCPASAAPLFSRV